MSKSQSKILKSAKREKAYELKQVNQDSETSKGKKKSIAAKYKSTLSRGSTVRKTWGDTSREIRTLSEAMCGQIASYYRKVVQSNIGDIDTIINAVHAIPYHLGANDTNAEYHKFCPKKIDSWCTLQVAILSGQTPPTHPNYISNNCVDMILTLFEQFGYDSPSFIQKIALGKTSNHNEAIYSVLFRMVRKTEAVGLDVMRLGSALAVIRYNDGMNGIIKIFESLGIEVTRHEASF